tara:strand:+ start:246 stop:425 length:180 start_codon:yes stop_codon:yes gene_type:complete
MKNNAFVNLPRKNPMYVRVFRCPTHEKKMTPAKNNWKRLNNKNFKSKPAHGVSVSHPTN